MLKKKVLLILSILSVAVFAFGCSNNNSENDQTDNNNNSSVEEPASDEKDAEEEDTSTNEDSKDKETSKNNTSSKGAENTDTPKKEETNASVYTIDLDNGSLVKKDVALASVDANSLYSELIKQKIIPNSSINSFEKKDVDGSTVGLLDVSSSFMNSNLGSDAETLTLDAVAKTFKENLGVSKIKLTVDGKNYESGHTVLEENDYL
ncbi:GerMN domain-containing protein [Metaclostridioides mangenotii]|uniref:GerMN domain-containing protein n=1 Tax=Metaclostridioides mangenotii TaxID=1540 RepID=UPI0004636E23|nr:GerMN domain-containing protein [Clostridioides mangenotii]